MKWKQLIPASALFCALAINAQAKVPLAIDLVHRDVEVVAHLNVRAIIDSDLGQGIIDRANRRKVESGAQAIEALSGTNLLTDVSEALIFGMVGRDDSIGLALEGKFDEEKLRNLIRMNPEAGVIDVSGMAVHTWFDRREERTKYAAILQSTVVIWNSEEAMNRSLKALTLPAERLSDGDIADFFPEEEDVPMLRLSMVSRTDRSGAAKLRVERARATLDVTDGSLEGTLTVTPEEESLAEHWEAMLTGGVALLRLQNERPPLAWLAEHMTVSETGDGRVLGTLSVDLVELGEQIPQRRR